MSTSSDVTAFKPTIDASDLRALVDYVLEHEVDDFYEQLCDDNIQPIDSTASGLQEWVIRRDLWEDAKESDSESEEEWWLAVNGKDHIYCVAARLSSKFAG